MKAKRIKYSLLGLAVAAAMTFMGTTYASAASPVSSKDLSSISAVDKNTISLTASEKQSIIDEFVSYGVDSVTASKIIKKYEAGQLPDSMNPDVKPLSIDREEKGEVVETIETYPDGSIAVETTSNLEAVKNNADSSGNNVNKEDRSVYGCKYTSGGNYASYWKNCTADVNLIVVRMGFKFDYESINGGSSKITGYRSYFDHVFGASLSNFRFSRISNTQVRLSADLSVAFKGFPAGWTAWMQANVSGSSAYTTHN